jgi:hypothetical protein
MTSCDVRRMPYASIAPDRRPAVITTAFSFSRVTRRSIISLQAHCQTDYRTKEITDFPVTNAIDETGKPRSHGQYDHPVLTNPASCTTSCRDKRKLQQATDSREAPGNFCPFDTRYIDQWCERRWHERTPVVR